MRSHPSRLVVAVIAMAALVATGASAPAADGAAPGGVRDRLSVAELTAEAFDPDGPVDNGYFMPMGTVEPARHTLAGVLEVPRTNIIIGPALFPGFSVAFFTVDGRLVPVDRDIVLTADDEWDIILSPGRVWSEPEDRGWSRASFPFVLAGKRWNESHNGLATFLFNHSETTGLTFQIVQEATTWPPFDAWGRVPLIYRPGPIDDENKLAAAFREELAERFPTAPLETLDADPDLVAGVEADLEEVTLTALLDDGVLYLGPCHTRYGDYPYCEEMRHGVYSITKSAGAALALLWLAERYGPQVFDLGIADYVDVTAPHDGWNDVTFRDAIDMATGIGDQTPDRLQDDGNNADEQFLIGPFAAAATARAKLTVAFQAGNYDWGPGEVVRYNSLHTFVLAAAMDAYLKSVEGPDADLWERLTEDVLRPIGIPVAPMMHTREADGTRGIPIMGWGLFPTVQDLAKIAQLYQDRGSHDGRQLLYADEIDRLLEGDRDYGLPVGRFNRFGQLSYGFSFWYVPFRDERECRVFVPEMRAVGDNLVALMPNGMTGIRFADEGGGPRKDWFGENVMRLADSLRPFCP